MAAVRSLPARQREAIVMREFEGRSYDEIGERLGASNGAVRQLLNRARAAVRERLCALVPAELLLRSITSAATSGPTRALTLCGTGALAAKFSSRPRGNR
jgi:predicted transcriptional regulator